MTPRCVPAGTERLRIRTMTGLKALSGWVCSISVPNAAVDDDKEPKNGQIKQYGAKCPGNMQDTAGKIVWSKRQACKQEKSQLRQRDRREKKQGRRKGNWTVAIYLSVKREEKKNGKQKQQRHARARFWPSQSVSKLLSALFKQLSSLFLTFPGPVSRPDLAPLLAPCGLSSRLDTMGMNNMPQPLEPVSPQLASCAADRQKASFRRVSHVPG